MDVAHAFHNVPIRPSDRQFMCGNGTRFLVFNVLGMGGKSSPNIRLAAATCRVILAVPNVDEFRWEIYVDDLILPLGS